MEKKIILIISSILGVESSKIKLQSSSDDFEEWDSIRHMNLIVALEEEFDVEFTDSEIPELAQVKIIIDIISAKL